MSQDPKRSKRLELDATDEDFGGLKSAYLETPFGEDTHIGKIMDFSSRGLRVHFDLPPDSFPHAGGILHNAVLGTTSTREELSRLIIRRVEQTDEGHVELGLEGEDEETRSSIWRTMHELENIAVRESHLKAGLSFDKVPRIPGRGHYSEKSRLERLAFVEEVTKKSFDTIRTTELEPDKLTGNIENMVGSLEIPVGIAGPLWFNGDNVQGPIYAPFATTEGALVASATRGAAAITRSGGVTTQVLRQRMIRVPLFILNNAAAATKFRAWVNDHKEEIRAKTREVSRHARLTEVTPDQVGNRVNVTFAYETGDAAGQNMTTSCTWHACQWIMTQMKHHPAISFKSFMVEGSMSGDKKVNFNSFLNGRGSRVTAECVITNEVLEKILKVSARQIEDNHSTAIMGGISIGMIGYNVNIANVIGAMFTALGQDIACVHESSLGCLRLHAEQEGLYAAIDIPALIVGSVGGGTGLPNQRDYLEMIDCAGAHKAGRLAEIIAGYCLALDLSTASAMASGQFASAHDRLGRNRPVQWLTQEDLKPSFFTPALRAKYDDPNIAVTAVNDHQIEMGSSIITELTARQVQKTVGLFPKQLVYKNAAGEEATENVMVKVKPVDKEVILVANTVAQMCGGHVAANHEKNKHRLGFQNCHVRELAVYRQTDPRFTSHAPHVYQCFEAAEREAFVVVMEDLSGLELMNTANDVTGWQQEHIHAAIDGIAATHAIWLGREDELKKEPWLGSVMTAQDMVEMKPLWLALAIHAGEEFPEWFYGDDVNSASQAILEIDQWWAEIETFPRTLIHNDFNPRNIGFRRMEDKSLKLCAYDWELATLHLPQRDLVELLSFVLHERTPREEIDGYIERHRQALEKESGQALDPEQWRRGYGLAVKDFAINRVNLYMMGHTFRNYKFLERVVRVVRKLNEYQKPA